MILISIGFLIINFSNLKYQDESEKSNYDYNPKVLVILPVKGLDFEFEKNLESLINQDYKNFKIVASIDDENDPAAEILKNIISHILSLIPNVIIAVER
jgi:Glycosyltransferases, probably involved in cell wall biogenesis